ncbi:MAG: tRNA uridine-5-carboxymethylaminomethyl(34) synthesis enzyme MnmG [Spirochaetota bacterium]|jgi:tRNA uridine 5-carboxymethylaminomethyl modification enzyme|nr:tRNA uridine-5-carboxymethylaminomethyl(34) synthesis enzyme MnmG [Spirochaetota bacterium]
MQTYGVIVIGGGHAGIEAASAAARILRCGDANARVALITPDSRALGRMSCNPAIGGTAKGHLVREIDALGGIMGFLCDRVSLQMRTLNLSKGAAVHATRAQADRALYEQEASHFMVALPGLDVIEDRAETILADGDPSARLSARGVRLASGMELESRFVIVATGTFLNGVLYNGLKTRAGGRYGEAASVGISESLRALGVTVSRLATSTPPRLYRASVDLDVLEAQDGDPLTRPFSRRTPRAEFPYLPQLPCFIAWTNPNTHTIIRDALDRAPQYTGDITGPSPKYCPAIEDKIVRFSERERHQLFLEPEGAESDLIYVNGFPTALPEEVQEAALKTVRGLENIRVARYGYGIEYDFVPASQLAHSLETKRIRGLYLAGQINGTSGYEEAASQGIMAGVNAARAYHGQEPIILGRHEAYIGVLIDDLISKAPLEPYRMFTSRAEFRLLLREDTTDRRLLRYGHEIGLVSDAEWEEEIVFEERLAAALDALRRIHIAPEKANIHLRKLNLPEAAHPVLLAQLALRANLPLGDLLQDIDPARWPALRPEVCDNRVLEAARIELRYEGYIAREREDAARFLKMEEKHIPEGIVYSAMRSLSAEAREVLEKIRPRTLGQAARLAGVRAADLSILMLSMRARDGHPAPREACK